jgi:protein-S-isoprenylcysteine O-methyltransferase Ste14
MNEQGEAKMTANKDAPNVVIRPPFALALALIGSFGLDWLYPLPFIPASLPRVWIGLVLFLLGGLPAVWAARTFRKSHTQVPTNQPATTIVSTGPYRFSRNPIYIGMFFGLVGFAIGFNTLWFLAAAIVLYFVIRFGVIAREEAYLESKFGPIYLDYKARVRRWL